MPTMTDKSKELHASVTLINDKLRFEGTAAGNDPLSIDYTAPLGDGLGYTSLELLLLSLSSCMGSSVLTLLRKMNMKVTKFVIHTNGVRKDEHPTGFGTIGMHIDVASPDMTEEGMQKAISLAEEKYCPVFSMLKGNVTVATNFTIQR